MSQMRILHTVEFYPPSTGGVQEVVRQISEHLALRGHTVTVATYRIPERKSKTVANITLEEFAISGNAVRGFQGEVERYRKFLCESRFDVVTHFAAQQWATDIALPLLDKISGKKVFVPTGFSGLYDRRFRSYFESMKTWMRMFDANIFLSDTYRDIRWAREQGIRNTFLIPNGAGEEEFMAPPQTDVRASLGIDPSGFLILHVGSHSGIKGHNEAIEIFRRANIRNATLLIVGNEVPKGCIGDCRRAEASLNRSNEFHSLGKRLVVATLPRPETVAAYHSADLFLFPSNVECSPLVLFECMASRTPFLTADTGNALEIIEWSGAGIAMPGWGKEGGFGRREAFRVSRKQHSTLRDIAHGYSVLRLGWTLADVEGSARILEMLYQSPEQRNAMEESGYRAWKERFTWEKIARQYETLYQSLLSS